MEGRLRHGSGEVAMVSIGVEVGLKYSPHSNWFHILRPESWRLLVCTGSFGEGVGGVLPQFLCRRRVPNPAHRRDTGNRIRHDPLGCLQRAYLGFMKHRNVEGVQGNSNVLSLATLVAPGARLGEPGHFRLWELLIVPCWVVLAVVDLCSVSGK